MTLAIGMLAVIGLLWLSAENVRLRRFQRGVVASRLGISVGDVLPNVRLAEPTAPATTGDGLVTLHDAVRGVAVLFYFTTTCDYCIGSLPAINQLRTDLADKQVRFVGIALDGPRASFAHLAEQIHGWRVLTPPDRETASALGAARVPMTVLVDDDAVVAAVWIGQVDIPLASAIHAAALRLRGR